jgi:ankyrin repeat protein
MSVRTTVTSQAGESYLNGASIEIEGREEVDLHELAKGWKAAVARATDPVTRHEATLKNDRGNLPLHSAASFRAPIDVTESLLEAFPEAAGMTNNYGNLALHFTAWKKGPLDVERLLLKVFPEGKRRNQLLAKTILIGFFVNWSVVSFS